MSGFTIEFLSVEQVLNVGHNAKPDWAIYINEASEILPGEADVWTVAAKNNGNQAHQFTGHAICAEPIP